MENAIPAEYFRLARVFGALCEDYLARRRCDENATTWCNTGLFDLFLPDHLTVIGQTTASLANNAPRRREHLVPRLVVAERCIELFKCGASLEEVARFLQQFLKIAWVSLDEARMIDSPCYNQKKEMPKEAGEWWNNSDSIYFRLENAGISRDQIQPC